MASKQTLHDVCESLVSILTQTVSVSILFLHFFKDANKNILINKSQPTYKSVYFM